MLTEEESELELSRTSYSPSELEEPFVLEELSTMFSEAVIELFAVEELSREEFVVSEELLREVDWFELFRGSAKTGVEMVLRHKIRLAKIEPTRRKHWRSFLIFFITDRICFYYSTHKRNCQEATSGFNKTASCPKKLF